MPRTQLARGSTKTNKRTGARTLSTTPVAIRSSNTLGDGFKRRIRTQLASRIEHSSGLVERVTVRFEDVNGPKGGVDIACRIKLVISGRPSIVVEKRAASHEVAFAQAATAVAKALRRTRGKHDLRQRVRPHRPKSPVRARAHERDAGALIGRRVGRGADALARALARPEKADRAAYTDTAARSVSASHRRAGGDNTARRNTRGRTTGATATLEDSRSRPSRKSTRRSANRGKPSQTKERAAHAQLQSPGERTSRRG